MAIIIDTVASYFSSKPADETVPATNALDLLMKYMFPPVEKKIKEPNPIFKTLAKKNCGFVVMGDDIDEDDWFYEDLPDPNDELEEYLDIDVEETKMDIHIRVTPELLAELEAETEALRLQQKELELKQKELELEFKELELLKDAERYFG